MKTDRYEVSRCRSCYRPMSEHGVREVDDGIPHDPMDQRPGDYPTQNWLLVDGVPR